MKNKKIRTGILVILLVFGIIAVSCSDDNVSINYKKAPQVSSVTVTKTTNNQYYIVSWDAVESDIGYYVYFKQAGKESSSYIGSGQNYNKYDPVTGNSINNDDLDKWSYQVDSLNAPAAGSYCFGVRTYLSNSTVSSTGSDVKWAAGITVTEFPKKISAVSAKKTTDGNYIIVSWDAVAGVSAYKINYYYRYSSNDSFYNNNTVSGQNTYTYSEDDGTQSTNTDPTKWSYRYTVSSLYGYEYYFSVTPNSGDISVISIATASAVVQ